MKAWGPQGAFLTAPEGLGPRTVCSKVALQDLVLPVSQISPVPLPSGRGSSPVDGARLTHISVPPTCSRLLWVFLSLLELANI